MDAELRRMLDTYDVMPKEDFQALLREAVAGLSQEDAITLLVSMLDQCMRPSWYNLMAPYLIRVKHERSL